MDTVGTAALAVLPGSFNRPMAIPEAVALIGLGICCGGTSTRPTTLSFRRRRPTPSQSDERPAVA